MEIGGERIPAAQRAAGDGAVAVPGAQGRPGHEKDDFGHLS